MGHLPQCPVTGQSPSENYIFCHLWILQLSSLVTGITQPPPMPTMCGYLNAGAVPTPVVSSCASSSSPASSSASWASPAAPSSSTTSWIRWASGAGLKGSKMGWGGVGALMSVLFRVLPGGHFSPSLLGGGRGGGEVLTSV